MIPEPGHGNGENIRHLVRIEAQVPGERGAYDSQHRIDNAAATQEKIQRTDHFDGGRREPQFLLRLP